MVLSRFLYNYVTQQFTFQTWFLGPVNKRNKHLDWGLKFHKSKRLSFIISLSTWESVMLWTQISVDVQKKVFTTVENCSQSKHRAMELSPNGYIYETLPPTRFREHCGSGGNKFKIQMIKVFSVRLCLWVMTDTIHINSQEYACSVVNWTRMQPTDLPLWKQRRP